MNALANPMIMKMALLIVISLVALVLLGFAVRFLRQSLVEGDSSEKKSGGAAKDFDVTLATYQSVIQQFKAQGQELERLRQQDRQRASTTENISDAVISNLTSGVVLFSPAGLVQQANAAAKKILGYASPYSLHARDVFRGATAVRSQAEGSLPEILDRAGKTREAVQRLEVDYSTPQGEPRVLGLTISPVQDKGGALLGTACLISDLTEMAKLTQQMRLQDNMASLGEMSAGIAHEFKNSLATISGYSQMLAQETEPETREFAQKIAIETNNLTRIVTDFLNFARPRGMQREPVDLISMLEDCAKENGIASNIAGGPAHVMGDATALRQVFSNLMRNSKEAARPGVEPTLEVWIESRSGQVVVRLADNGSGIPKDKLDKIFIPFFTTKAQGTGLGLALVHRIITDHGGTVSVESTESGTTFAITLPAATEAANSSTN